MPLTLRDIKGAHKNAYCVSLTLAAITGRTEKDIGRLVHSGLHGRKLPKRLRTDDDVDDWLAIANFLGGNCTPGDDYSEISFSERPTIESWMAGKNRRNLELVFCDDGASIGHVFATENNEVVDTYTDGKRARFQGVPQEYGALRVGRTFRLW